MKRTRAIFVIMTLLFGITLAFSTQQDTIRDTFWSNTGNLPQPSSMENAAFEEVLYPWLQRRAYADLDGWEVDKRVRDTGPFIDNNYYGVHPAVRMYYSPGMFSWLKGGRIGNPPNGAILVKEMYSPPAAKYQDMTAEDIANSLSMWTVMIRDSGASWDGWYWGAYNTGQLVDDPMRYDSTKGFRPASSGYSTYCMRCHAAPVDDMTFSSLSNIKGQPGNPLQYKYDESWWPQDTVPDVQHNEHVSGYHDRIVRPDDRKSRRRSENPNFEAFTKFFDELPPVPKKDIQAIPPRGFDHVFSLPSGPLQFISADNCMPCHSGSNSVASGINMFLPDTAAPGGKGWNVSPYGEWQGSMMGLAGRDPIFFAQLESETTIHHQDTLPGMLQNTCLSCHGVMGQREFHADDKGHFYEEKHVFEKGDLYGALSRDGISCMVCHQIVDKGEPLLETATGKFNVSQPGEFEKEDGKNISWIYGPYKDVSTHPMMEGLGIRPKYSSLIKESKLCSSCHTVYLPVFDGKGKPVVDKKDVTGYKHVYEQSTYLEWQNSAYQNEVNPKESDVKTCQTCHMPTTFPYDETGKPLTKTKIANVQDQSYPAGDHLAPWDSLFVNRRDTFHRHTLLGINQFGLEFFNQFDSLLGIYKTDYMTGGPIIPQAIHSSQILATKQTAELEFVSIKQDKGKLSAEVEVTSKVGHRFPSGVGFRRAFLAFEVYDEGGEVVWASGKTNSLGIILGPDDKPLPSEFFDEGANGEQIYEPHHRTITREDQVQIYQELVKDPEGRFTTSFISINEHVKDNRLLPKGWKKKTPVIKDPKQLEATQPQGKAVKDPDYGGGGDRIRYLVNLPKGVKAAKVVARLYYQAIPPYYLKDRFETAKGTAGQRLHYLASNLDLKGTNIKDWKLEVTSVTANLLNP